MQVNVKIDTTALLRWANELSTAKIKGAIKSGLNRAGRRARTEFIANTAADANVPSARIRKGISPFRSASPSRLVAAFDAKPVKIGILSTAGATISKGSGLHAATHVVTGGGSASLDVQRAFVITTANGGRVVMIRRGSGRKNIKAIYAEQPATALNQGRSAPRIKWLKTAADETAREITAGLQAVMNGGSPASDAGSSD